MWTLARTSSRSTPTRTATPRSRRHRGAQILQISQPEFLRAKLCGFNSIAWLIWHVARGEDWGINAMVRGEEQVLHRESWGDRLGIERRDWGFGMSDADVAELSQSLDLDALRGYFDAVAAATRSFMETFDFDDLDAPLNVEARLATVPESSGPTPARWSHPRPRIGGSSTS